MLTNDQKEGYKIILRKLCRDKHSLKTLIKTQEQLNDQVDLFNVEIQRFLEAIHVKYDGLYSDLRKIKERIGNGIETDVDELSAMDVVKKLGKHILLGSGIVAKDLLTLRIQWFDKYIDVVEENIARYIDTYSADETEYQKKNSAGKQLI